MTKELNEPIAILLKDTTSLSDGEKSAIYAGLSDFFEGTDKIKKRLSTIARSKNKEIVYESFNDIYFEMVHHIKPHIESLETPMLKALKEWERK